MLYRTASGKVFSCLRVTIILGLFAGLSEATGTLCFGDSQFYRYTSKKSWTQAKETCQGDFKGDLAKLDSVDLITKLHEVYSSTSDSVVSYVGGRRGDDGKFRWWDGTELLRDVPYRENGEKLGCLRLNHPTLPSNPNFASVDCNRPQEFLCQRESQPIIKDHVEMISTSEQSITCKTDWCSPIWISKDGGEIPRCGEQSNRICQIISDTESRLRFNNASDKDSGVYRCKIKNEFSTFQSAIVKAVGPKIRRIEKTSCSAITTLKWMTSPYLINYTHVITLSDGHRFDAIPRDSDPEQSLTLTSLSPSTHYTLNLTACNKTCFPLFAPSTTNFTTNGPPNKVERIYSVLVDTANCSIKWSLMTSSGVSKYKIQIVGSTIAYRSKKPYNQSWDNEVEKPMFDFKPRPNTKYTVSISASNCGGTGQSAAVIANCTLASAAPESVAAPVIISTGIPESPKMRIMLPNEYAGLISCILVMVTEIPSQSSTVSMSEDMYSRDEFRSLFTSNTTSNEYVAMAISPNSFASKKYLEFIVGEDSESVCNISDISTTDVSKSNTCGGECICGRNKELRNQTRYRTYVGVVVPFNNIFVSVRRSENAFFETIPVNTDFTESNTIVAIVLGAVTCLLLLALIGMIVIKIYRTKSRNITTSVSGSSRMPDYEVMNDTSTLNAPHPPPRRLHKGPHIATNSASIGNSSPGAQMETRLGAETGNEESAYEICTVKEGQRLKTDTLIAMDELESVYKKKLNNKDNGFSVEYRRLLRQSSKRNYFTRVASDPGLKSKNRYKNILPYDASRVVLKETATGYINASYVDGVDMPNKYIATQGPLPKTISDFWVMIYEMKCPIIVMLTRPVESGKKKCERYWPKMGRSSSFHNFSVENTREESFGGYVRRTFKISGEARTFASTQYHYLNWPDHGAPLMTTHLTHMYAAMTRELKTGKSGPIVVHCSAGAGRTGAFIGYDIILNEWEKYGAVDFYNCVMKMREQRIDMVQNTGQYTFMHKMVLESYIHGVTDYTVDEFKRKYEDLSSIGTATELNTQFQRIGCVKPLNDELLEICKKDYVYINSGDAAQIYAHSRVHVVMDNGQNESAMIEASWIETEDSTLRMIAARTPTHSDAGLYWRALVDNSVGTIVSLSPVDNTERYYPVDTDEPLLLEGGAVTLVSCVEKESVTERRFIVGTSQRQVAVTMLQCNVWKTMEDMSAKEIISLIQLMKATALQAEQKVTIIQCSDGIGRTGAYCTLVNLLDRIYKEKRIDVVRAVKDLKDARPMMVKNQEQFKMCYKLIWTYLNSIKI